MDNSSITEEGETAFLDNAVHSPTDPGFHQREYDTSELEDDIVDWNEPYTISPPLQLIILSSITRHKKTEMIRCQIALCYHNSQQKKSENECCRSIRTILINIIHLV